MTIKPKGGIEVLMEYFLRMTFKQKMDYRKIRKELREASK